MPNVFEVYAIVSLLEEVRKLSCSWRWTPKPVPKPLKPPWRNPNKKRKIGRLLPVCRSPLLAVASVRTPISIDWSLAAAEERAKLCSFLPSIRQDFFYLAVPRLSGETWFCKPLLVILFDNFWPYLLIKRPSICWDHIFGGEILPLVLVGFWSNPRTWAFGNDCNDPSFPLQRMDGYWQLGSGRSMSRFSLLCFFHRVLGFLLRTCCRWMGSFS